MNRRTFLATMGIAAPSTMAWAKSPQPPAPCFHKLPDGRSLAYEIIGQADAKTTFLHFHGLPSCRWEIEPFRPFVEANPSIRMIAFDRPGMGQSTSSPQLTFDSMTDDAVHFVDHLKLDRFFVSSTSAGTPAALKLAHRLPDRVRHLLLVCPVGEYRPEFLESISVKGLETIEKHPRIAEVGLNSMTRMIRRNPKRASTFLKSFSPRDRDWALSPSQIEDTAGLIAESLRCGSGEMFRLVRLMKSWGCFVKEMKTPATILHGDQDRNATPKMVEWVHAQLPHAKRECIEGEGHLTIITHRRVTDVMTAQSETLT